MNQIVFVADAPSQVEVVRGGLFTGYARNILSDVCARSGVNLDEDCKFISMSPVPLPNKLSKSEALSYQAELRQRLIELQPRAVVLCGAGSILAMGLGSGPQVSHGKKTYDSEIGCVIINSFNPIQAFYTPDILRDLRMDLMHLGTYERRVDPTVLPPLPWVLVEHPSQIHQMQEDFERILKRDGGQFLGILDIETKGLNPRRDGIFSVGISFDEESNWIVTDEVMRNPVAHKWLKSILEDKSLDWAGQNLYQFDYKFLRQQYGIRWSATIDTMLAHYTLDERQTGHGLKYLAQQYFNAPNWGTEIDWDKSHEFTDEFIRNEMYPYQVYDLYFTRKLVPVLSEAMREEGGDKLVDLHYDVLIPGAKGLGTLEMNGIHINEDYLDELDEQITKEYEETYARLQEEAKRYGMESINPNSPKQVKALVLDKVGLKATAGSGTDREALESMDHPVSNLILEARVKSKLKGTYVVGLRNRIEDDGCVHGDFLLWGTSTGRLSSRNPNLQNIPSVMGPIVKRAFTPRNPGWEIVNIDYSQLELRVAGILSGDDYLRKAYVEDKDLHTLVAASMYQITPEEVTKMQRYHAKYVDFGVLYGRQAKSLAEVELKCSVAEAQRFIDNFLADFDKLNDWIKSQHEFVAEHGYVETAFGRRRRFPVISRTNISEIQRQAVNSPIQGTASDFTLTALGRIVEGLDQGGLEENIIPLITVHDSLVFEVNPDYMQQLVRLAHYEMTQNIPIDLNGIPIQVDMERGPNYGDVKEFDWKDMLAPEYRVTKGKVA